MPWKIKFFCLPLTLVGLGVAVSPASSNAQASWPQFHFSPDRSGFNPDEFMLSPDNVANLGLSWTATVGAVPLTSPVVSDSMVYAGSNDGNLYAFDAATGMTVWSAPTGASIIFEAAVAGGQVFVGSDDTKVYAFPTSCSTPCAPLWAVTTAGRISSTPAVSDGVVYIGAGRGPDGDLWAIDAVTGATIWTAPLPSAPKAPAVADGVIYTTANALYAFPATCSTPCSPLWIGPGVGALPAVSDGTVFVDAGFVNRFQAFPTSCSSPCSPLWTAFTESNAVTAPAIAGGNVYLVEFNGALQAFPAKCSTPCMPIWTMRGFSPYSSPAVANGVIYVGGADNKIYALDAATGAILFSGPIGGTSYVLSPAVADGVVYTTASFFSPGTLAAFALPQ